MQGFPRWYFQRTILSAKQMWRQICLQNKYPHSKDFFKINPFHPLPYLVLHKIEGKRVRDQTTE